MRPALGLMAVACLVALFGCDKPRAAASHSTDPKGDLEAIAETMAENLRQELETPVRLSTASGEQSCIVTLDEKPAISIDKYTNPASPFLGFVNLRFGVKNAAGQKIPCQVETVRMVLLFEDARWKLKMILASPAATQPTVNDDVAGDPLYTDLTSRIRKAFEQS